MMVVVELLSDVGRVALERDFLDRKKENTVDRLRFRYLFRERYDGQRLTLSLNKRAVLILKLEVKEFISGVVGVIESTLMRNGATKGVDFVVMVNE